MTSTTALLLGIGMILATPPEDPAQTVREFDLVDLAGQKHTTKEWAKAKAVVLFFVSTDCPASNGYAPEMARLAKVYTDKGVLFYGIHSDPDLTAEQASIHAKEHQLSFPILLDPLQSLARQAGVKRVSTAVVLSPEGKVLYCGRIDDQYISLGKKRPEPTQRDTQDTLDQILAGKTPAVARTDAIGCLLPKISETPAQKPR